MTSNEQHGLDDDTPLPYSHVVVSELFAYAHENGAIWRLDNCPSEIDFNRDGWVPLYRNKTETNPIYRDPTEIGRQIMERIAKVHPWKGQCIADIAQAVTQERTVIAIREAQLRYISSQWPETSAGKYARAAISSETTEKQA